jgi:hypothetical protein
VTPDLADPAATEANAEDSENVGQIATAGGVQDEALAEKQEQQRQRQIEDEGDREGKPPLRHR